MVQRVCAKRKHASLFPASPLTACQHAAPFGHPRNATRSCKCSHEKITLQVRFMWFTLSAQSLGLGTDTSAQASATLAAVPATTDVAVLSNELHSPADFIRAESIRTCASELEFDLQSCLAQLLLGILIQTVARQTAGVAGKQHRVLKAKN